VPAAVRRAHTLYRIGRIGVFAIPIVAVLAVLGQTSTAAFTSNPATYAHYLATQRFTPMEIAITIGTGVFGVFALVGMTALLYAGRARWLAITGFAVGIIGAGAMLVSVMTVIVRATRVAGPLVHWRLDQVVINANAKGMAAAITVVGGAALLSLAWILLGIAASRTYGLSTGDGALLAVSAPMIYFGGFFLNALPTMGAFLLAAAGLGIAFAAGRLAPTLQVMRAPIRVDRPTSAFARFIDEEFEPEFADTSIEEGALALAGASGADPSASGGSRLATEDASAVVGAGAVVGASAGGGAGAVVQAGAGASTPGASRPSGLSRLSRGISTAWPVTRRKGAAAPAKTPVLEAGSASAKVLPSRPPATGEATRRGAPDTGSADPGAAVGGVALGGSATGTWVKDDTDGASVKGPQAAGGPGQAPSGEASSGEASGHAPSGQGASGQAGSGQAPSGQEGSGQAPSSQEGSGRGAPGREGSGREASERTAPSRKASRKADRKADRKAAASERSGSTAGGSIKGSGLNASPPAKAPAGSTSTKTAPNSVPAAAASGGSRSKDKAANAKNPSNGKQGNASSGRGMAAKLRDRLRRGKPDSTKGPGVGRE
jgi:hypothetical protein